MSVPGPSPALWAALAVAASAASFGAELQGEDWFRLEVVVFERYSADDPGIARPHLLDALVYPLAAVPLAAMRSEEAIIGARPSTVSDLPPPLWFAGDCISPYWAPPPGWADRDGPVPRDPCLPEPPKAQSDDLEEPLLPLEPPSLEEPLSAFDQARAELAEAIAARERELFEASYVWARDLAHLARERRLVGRRFEVLAAGSWHQRLPPREQPLPLLVQAGELGDDGRFALEGLFSVTMGRYIHFRAELHKRAGEGFALLSESRRMRSDELHYLDHPALGILVRAERLEVPDALLALEARVEELEAQSQ